MINNISQILITKEPELIPPLINEAVLSVRNTFQNCSYTLYDNEKIIELIKNNFDINTLKAYNKIRPFAGKADLARYCIKYLNGGWYVDLGIKMSSFMIGKTINLPDNIDFLAFRDFGDGFSPKPLSYHLQNSIFYSKPKNKILEKAIELVIENCKTENQGLTPVCPTGPGVFGRSLACVGAKKTQIIGMFMALTPHHKNMNNAYVLPDGTIFALHKTSWLPQVNPGDLKAFGFNSTNNYIKMYMENDFYDSSIDIL